jgi:hypothetical protein
VYLGSQKGQDRAELAFSIVIDAHRKVTEVKRPPDPFGEGLDEDAAATDSGELPRETRRGSRLAAHKSFLWVRD